MADTLGIAYFLRSKTRSDRTSKTNAILAIKLPDENNSYNYDLKLFNIIQKTSITVSIHTYQMINLIYQTLIFFMPN